MGQRLFRAKQKIRHAGIPFRVPPDYLLPERLPSVRHVLYLLFNEGYGASGGGDSDKTSAPARPARTLPDPGGMAPRQPDPRWQDWGIDFPDLRFIMLHVIKETACHTGHLDAVRELLDGRQWIVM